MEGRGRPGDRGSRDGAVAAGVHLRLHPLAVRGAPRAGGRLVLVPNARQQQGIEPGIQCWAVGWVRMEHGVVVPGVDVWVRVRMVDVVDVGVATRALGAQAVGPAIREGSRRWEAGLGEHMVGPQSSVWGVEGNGAGGEVWVDRDRDRREAGSGLGWIGAVPHRAALTLRQRPTI